MAQEARAPANNRPAKTWLGTLFPSEQYSLEQLEQALRDLEGVNHMTCGREVCGETGREHLQVAITWKQAHRLTAMRRLAGGNHHWEIARWCG